LGNTKISAWDNGNQIEKHRYQPKKTLPVEL